MKHRRNGFMKLIWNNMVQKASNLVKHPILWAVLSVWLSNFAIDAYRSIYPSHDDLKGRNVIVIPTTKFNEIIETIGGNIKEVKDCVDRNEKNITQNANRVIVISKINEFQDYKIEENKRKIDKL